MSSDYKDFTAYNDEAEKIRPTARIQLVQRLLNAANLISSLGQGVPLKWAQSYKGFQVLKYSENQDPEDITSANAVSAVDSILHEAEAQLRASLDDMNSLKLEAQKMPITGSALWTNFYPIPRDTYFNILSQVSNSVTYRLCVKTDDLGDLITDKVYVMTETKWNSLPSNSKIDVVNDTTRVALEISCPMGEANGRPYVRCVRLVNPHDYYDVVVGGYYATSSVRCWTFQITDHYVVNPNSVQKYNFGLSIEVGNVSLPSDSQITTIDLPSVGMRTEFEFEGNGGKYPTIPITGSVDTDEALGLPDPSNLIDILDRMTD